MRFGWAARAIEQDATGVRVDIGETAALATRGARGRLRRRLRRRAIASCASRSASSAAAPNYEQLMVLAVFRSSELHEGLKRFPERSTYRVLHPELKGYWQFFGRIDVGEGWFFHAPVPADTTSGQLRFPRSDREAVAASSSPCEFDHRRLLGPARRGRREIPASGACFIAGDAAHSHPPYGGFGLNNGLEDVVNLGWKLAREAAGLGRRRAARNPTARSAADLQGDRRGFHRRAHRAGRRASSHRYSPGANRAEFERAWNAIGKPTSALAS